MCADAEEILTIRIGMTVARDDRVSDVRLVDSALPMAGLEGQVGVYVMPTRHFLPLPTALNAESLDFEVTIDY